MTSRNEQGQWLPGTSGNPQGRRPKKIITESLLLALTEAAADGDRTKARAIADKLVEKALEGDIQAIKEAMDRTEGKAPQPISGDPDGAPVAHVVSWLPPQDS